MCSCYGECIWCVLVVVSVFGCLLLWLVYLVCSCCGECIWCSLVVVSVFGVLLLR